MDSTRRFSSAVDMHDLLQMPLADLLDASETMTLDAFGPVVTYSRKIFIPLTRLCRDVCHYCTFATAPGKLASPYLSINEVLEIARAGRDAGCREALFTLGDRPEDRYRAARDALTAMGHPSTLSYLREVARRVLDETGLLPHLNPGVMTDADYAALRPVSASMGLMLETASPRLSERGGPHFGSPDKAPRVRLEAIEAAGRAKVPFTTGILVGIGETHAERLEALLAIRDSHLRHGHVQEVIIQNFRAKSGTRMADHPEPALEEQLWTIAAARLVLGTSVSIQAPPNLRPEALSSLLRAGVNDWGGVSPVTRDHVNPEAPWPELATLARQTAAAGRVLRERLAIGPEFALAAESWADPALAPRILQAIDGRGLPVIDGWRPGRGDTVPTLVAGYDGEFGAATPTVTDLIGKAVTGIRLSEGEVTRLFRADGAEIGTIIAAADELRASQVGDTVSYVVNRNINYTNICLYRCGFCAFSKGSTRKQRGPAYLLDLDEVGRRAAEAAARGASEVCLQGGIHPDFDGHTYVSILRAVRAAAPGIHIHAFSPLEIMHGAESLDMPLDEYLGLLRNEGLASLPGTAAEILDDEVRAVICPDKIDAAQWLEVMRQAHKVGLRSTATIMFGHVELYRHWARHLLAIRDLQQETGGFTEFVPLPFVHMEAPIWARGRARSGPSWRETVLMHAVARLVLHPLIGNIQASWVKNGFDGAGELLKTGVNDIGGTLMDESITRAAGGVNGQNCTPKTMATIALSAGRNASRRTTFYADAATEPETVQEGIQSVVV